MEKLTLESLFLYDQGSVAVLVDQALRQIYLDCEDRPTLEKNRKLTISMSFKPEPNKTLEGVVTEIAVKCSLPDKQARSSVIVPVKKLGGFAFDPNSRRAQFHPDQQELDLKEEQD